MSDDSFIREVDEELRSARLQDFWKKYGNIVIALAVAIVLATGGYRFYEYYTNQKAAEAGDAFMSAVRLAQEGKQDEAVAAFAALEDHESPSYRTLALMRGAAELAENGKKEEALSKFDLIAADTSADENMRAIARIRAAHILVDTGSVQDVESRVSPLTAPGAPYRASAREAIGLAYFKAGDLENAFKQFDEISKDIETPQALRQRVTIMLSLIASRGGPTQTDQ